VQYPVARGPLVPQPLLRQTASPLPSTEVPQADRPERVIALVEAAERAGAIDADALGLHGRDADYYVAAAVSLGLLDGERALLPAAHALLALPPDARLARLALAFEASRCGRAWLRWAPAKNLLSLDPATAGAFLSEVSDLSAATISRRARTLSRWCADLSKVHPAVSTKTTNRATRSSFRRSSDPSVQSCRRVRTRRWTRW
jgi:hypothetical protein